MRSSAFSLSTSATVCFVGRFTTNPSAPSLSWRTMKITVRSKYDSARRPLSRIILPETGFFWEGIPTKLDFPKGTVNPVNGLTTHPPTMTFVAWSVF